MNFDPSQLEGEHLPRHELLLDISEGALQLISALRVQRDSDIKRAILYLDLTSNTFSLPAFVMRNLPAYSVVEEIILDTTINRLTQQAELDLRISAVGTENVFMNISSQPDAQTPTSSLVIDETELPLLDPPTGAELNRFLASLFMQNKTGNYSVFDAMNINNAQTAERLVDALEDAAMETILDETYFLSETVGLTTDSINFTECNGVIHNATVSVEHHACASSLEVSFLKPTGYTEPEEGVDNTEFLMQQLEGTRTFIQDIDGVSTQVESTNDFLLVVRDFLTEQGGRVFQQPVESLNMIEVADESLSINIEDLGKS